MPCENETITVPVWFRVDAEVTGVSGVSTFGPVCSREMAEQLLITLSARTNVTKATLVRYTEEEV